MNKSALTMPPFGDGNAPQDSPAYAVYVRDMASASLHSLHVDLKGVELYTSILQEKKLYRNLQDADGRFFRGWTEFCLAKRPYGLERTASDIATLLQEHRDPASLAAQAEDNPLTKNGEIGNGRSSLDIIKPNQGGTSSEYLTRRIARDKPEILEEMKAGKYPSVRAAAKAAGIIRELTPLDALKRLWKRANDDERRAFLLFIGKETL